MSVSMKVRLTSPDQNVEVRRFNLDKEVSTSLTFLQEKLCIIFPSLKRLNFTIFWTDEEGDEVTVANNEDIITALTEMEGPVYTLSVKVTDKKQKEEGEEKEDNKSTNPGFHLGVICDGCQQSPLTGPRYKCLFCPNFDLCANCEGKGRHPEHPKVILNPQSQKKAQSQTGAGCTIRGVRPTGFSNLLFDTLVTAWMDLSSSSQGTTRSNEPQEENKNSEDKTPKKVQTDRRAKNPKENTKTDFTKETQDIEVENILAKESNDALKTKSKADAEKNDVSEKKRDKLETTNPTEMESEKEKINASGNDWTIITESDIGSESSSKTRPTDDMTGLNDKEIEEMNDVKANYFHLDPQVQVALEAMLNMGFNNQDGWLTNLLMAKNGDVGNVLDLIRPTKA